MIDEVIVQDQETNYDILKKVHKAYKANIAEAKNYHFTIQVAGADSQPWIDYNNALNADSFCSDSVNQSIFGNPLFLEKAMNNSRVKPHIQSCQTQLSDRENIL